MLAIFVLTRAVHLMIAVGMDEKHFFLVCCRVSRQSASHLSDVGELRVKLWALLDCCGKEASLPCTGTEVVTGYTIASRIV